MNPYMAYEAVNTKIITRKSHILDENKLEKVLECNTVEQLTDFLKSKYDFKKIIDDAKGHDLHRDELETLLDRYEVMEIESILHYFSGPYKEFLQVLLMEFEIYDLSLILRKIAQGVELNGLEKHFIHSKNYSSLPYNKLTASKSVSQFIENLKNTPYYNFLKTVTNIDVVKREFHIEMKLQLLLYKTLVNKSEKLSALDKQVAKEIIGLKIDFLNVQWIYRAKKYYNISPEQILIYSLQGGEKLSFNKLKKLCYSKSIEEIQQLSGKYLRYSIFTANNETDIERNIDKYMYSYIKDGKYRGTIGSALSYFYMLDIVIKDFITVTEGIRYKLPKEDLKKYLAYSK